MSYPPTQCPISVTIPHSGLTPRKPFVLTEIDFGALWAAQKLDKSFQPVPDAEAISNDNADSEICVVDTTPHFANQSRV
jgi:hypothetical protein